MYANCIIEGGLLENILTKEGVEIYNTTEKGRDFLKDYDNIRKILDKMRL
jgi:predicted transcriptional regulator